MWSNFCISLWLSNFDLNIWNVWIFHSKIWNFWFAGRFPCSFVDKFISFFCLGSILMFYLPAVCCFRFILFVILLRNFIFSFSNDSAGFIYLFILYLSISLSKELFIYFIVFPFNWISFKFFRWNWPYTFLSTPHISYFT